MFLDFFLVLLNYLMKSPMKLFSVYVFMAQERPPFGIVGGSPVFFSMSAYNDKDAKWFDHSANKNYKGSSSGGWKQDQEQYSSSWHKGAAAAASNKEPDKSYAQALQNSWWDVKPANILELADDRFAGQQKDPWP